MGIANVLTENDERLIAEEIVKLLLQKGVSYRQAESILEIADNRMRNIPITESIGQNA